MRLAAHPLRLLAPAFLLVPAVLLGAAPAQAARARTPVPEAQPADDGPAQGDEKVNQLIVYGDDPCPVSTAEQITVCARKDEAERFRIPAPLRDNPTDPRNQSWTDRVKAYETVGAAGINSCSPVGSGGASGCTTRLIQDAYAEKKQGSDVQFGKLIEEERQRRMSTIDKDAAAEQSRVEQLEKEYEARLARERDGETKPAPATPPASN
jgi:hypothetical protein